MHRLMSCDVQAYELCIIQNYKQAECEQSRDSLLIMCSLSFQEFDSSPDESSRGLLLVTYPQGYNLLEASYFNYRRSGATRVRRDTEM